MTFEGTLELNSPLSKEDWGKLTDVELEKSDHIWFTTPSGKRIDYIKASVIENIRADIELLKADGLMNMDAVLHVINIHTKGGLE